MRSPKSSARRKTTLLQKSPTDISTVNKKDLLAAHKEADSLLKRDQDDERNRAKENMKGDEYSSIIIMPKYITDPRLKVDRESYPEPPKELYIGLGWDEDKDTQRKHYR